MAAVAVLVVGIIFVTLLDAYPAFQFFTAALVATVVLYVIFSMRWDAQRKRRAHEQQLARAFDHERERAKAAEETLRAAHARATQRIDEAFKKYPNG